MTQPTPAENDPTLVLWLTGELTRFAESGANPVEAAERIASHLAAARRLIPDGTTTRSEWGTRFTWDDATVEDPEVPTSLDDAQVRVAFHRERREAMPEWRATADLVHRQVHTTPWTVASTAEVKP